MTFINIPRSNLHNFATTAFEKLGFSMLDASCAAEVLVWADERGVETHGIINLLEIYAPKIRSGEIDINAEIIETRQLGAASVFNANGRLGLLVGSEAMQRAIALASTYGIGCVAVHDSTHFGAAGYFAEMALAQGQIGVAMTNLGAQPVAAPIGGEKCLGTNPIAVAAGSLEKEFFSYDASTTVVASGKIKAAARRGENVPEGWLYGRDGAPETDPQAYLDGDALPTVLGGMAELGGYKGLGLNILVEVLCGLLTGGPTAADPTPQKGERAGIGHFFLAIKLEAFGDPTDFVRRVDKAMRRYSDKAEREGWQGLTYPGQPESISLKNSKKVGVQIEKTLFDKVHILAADLGIPALQERG